jgi:hypothetical protein
MYKDEQSAAQCEMQHKKAEEKKMADIAKEKDLLSAINHGINVYMQMYGRFPQIELTEENQNLAIENAIDVLADIFE